MSISPETTDNATNTASTKNFDNLVLNSLLRKLQIDPAAGTNNETLSELDLQLEENSESPVQRHRAHVLREETKLEQHLVRIIHSGKTETLKPNSGEAICVNDHYVCISSYEEKDSDYRVWEWHGHIMTYTEWGGFSPEYFYGNYFERLPGKTNFDLWYEEKGGIQLQEEEEDEMVLDLGLRGLIGGLNCTNAGRVLHRNVNADSKSFL